VTEIFNAVTGRMLAPKSQEQSAEAMVPIAALAGASAAGSRVTTVATETPNKPNFKMRTKEVSYQILAGAAQRLEPSLQAGAVGAVVAFGAAAPTACFEVYAAWKEGDHALAKEKQERISAAAKRMAELGIPALKYAMDLNGYYGGPARLPFLPLTAELRREVEQLMADIRN
jgi:4-hydroxy-2-oxoglutarate aldolase